VRFVLKKNIGIYLFLVFCLLVCPVLAQTGSGLKEGTKASEFKVTSLDGENLDSTELTGQVLVLNFWFIQCPPCRAEIPKLNELVNAYHGKPVKFIAFAPDDETSLGEFLSSNPFEYKIVANATPIAVNFGVIGAPTHIVINPTGEIAKVYLGEVSSPLTELGLVIDKLLLD